jgi:hypothetical protein
VEAEAWETVEGVDEEMEVAWAMVKASLSSPAASCQTMALSWICHHYQLGQELKQMKPDHDQPLPMRHLAANIWHR